MQNGRISEFSDNIESIMSDESISSFDKEYYSDSIAYFAPFVYKKNFSDFSYTNSKIDFSKVYSNVITGCNFEGLDFSEVDFQFIDEIYNSNFSNTKITTNLDFNNIKCVECNFSNNDLSSVVVDYKIFSVYNETNSIEKCYFKNTGLNIKYESPKIPIEFYEVLYEENYLNNMMKKGCISVNTYSRFINEYFDIFNEYQNEYYDKRILGKYIKENYLDGCYINGKRISSSDERQKIALSKRLKYEKFKKEIFSSVINDFNGQIKGFTK